MATTQRDSRRVLLVEDDHAIRELMQTVLQGMGLAVDVASNGPRALELAAQHRPSLVVLDLGLPEMYGKAVAAHLRTKYRGLPVMVVSALSASAVAEDAWEMGAFTYMTKPFELDAFTSAVQKGLELGHKHRARAD
ncbi:MAG TPA: response regulator [Chloroflexota bacterium]|nr:response regulator [Chloroflexota bacterium]